MFGTSARVAGDESQPLNRRLTNLSNAIEKFRLLGFHWTFDQLYKATGASPNNWTSEQVSTAARLLINAHESWMSYLRETQAETRRRKKGEPAYKPTDRRELFDEWRGHYFSASVAREWALSEPTTPGQNADSKG